MQSSSFMRDARRALCVLVLGCASASGASAQDARPPARNPNPVPLAGFGGMAGTGVAGVGGGVAPPGNAAIVTTGPVPANGAVLLVADQPENLSLTAIPLNGTTTTPLTGSLTQVEGAYWAWQPDSPFVPGVSYGIEGRFDNGMSGSFVSFVSNVNATDAIELHHPALNSEPAVSWVSELHGQVCCQLWTEVGIEIGACAPTEQSASMQLGPGLSSPEAQALLGQYLYRIWPEGEDPAGYAYNPWGVPIVLELTEQADEYCYAIETLSIVDAGRQVHEELAPRCAPHGDAAPIGEMVLDLPEGFLDHSECHEPPAMLAEPWCEVNAACEGDARAEGCVLFGYLCEDEPLPTWTPAGGMVFAPQDAGSDDAAAEEDASVAGSGGMGGGDSGDCSVARPGRGQPAVFLFSSIAMALIALGRRRRRNG